MCIRDSLTGAWFFFISKMFAAALKVYVVCTVLQVLVFDPFGVPFAVLSLIHILCAIR